MNKFKELILSGLGGLIVSYPAYFLILQKLRMTSMVRFGLLAIILLIFTTLLYLLSEKIRLDRSALQGLAALFLLLNLIMAARVDFLNIPYTIPLLPVQTITLTPGTDQLPVQIRSVSTELSEDLNLEQLKADRGWELEGKRRLSQIPGTVEPISWIGKPGQMIEFEIDACEGCGSIILSHQGKTVEISLENDSKQSTFFPFQFRNLTWHKLLNFFTLEGSLLVLSMILITALGLIQAKTDSGAVLTGKLSRLRQIPPQAWLIMFPVVLFSFKIKPVVFNDDWCQIIQPIQQGTFKFFELYSRRPLHLSIGWIFSQFLPINQAVIWMQVTHLIFIILIALLVYRLLAELFEGDQLLALLGALLFTFFPNDYTYFYLSILGIRFSLILTLIAMLGYLKYTRMGQVGNAWTAAGLILVGLLGYEGQFGLYLAWPLVVGLLFSFRTLRDRIAGTIIYYLPAVVFPIWRVLIQPIYYQDTKLGSLNADLIELASYLVGGIRTIFGGFTLPYQDASWLTQENILILSAVFILGILVFLISQHGFASQAEHSASEHKGKSDLWLLLSGLILWGAGYLPVILNIQPNIWGHMSRVNIFTVFGAVLTITAGLKAIASSMSWNRKRVTTFYSATMMVMILFGAIVHLQVQESIGRSWQETKSFYQQLFDLAPELRDNTELFIYVQGEDNTKTPHRPLITSTWEPRCTVQVLYNSSEIGVSFEYQQIFVPEYPGAITVGSALARQHYNPELKPENILGIVYNRQTQQVSILDEIGPFFGKEIQRDYRPLKQITPLEEENLSRQLVK